MKTVLICGGTIIDPSQHCNKKASLLCIGGKVSEIIESSSAETLSELMSKVDQVIDASGKIVCPGFVDIHMHEDPYDPESGRLDKSIASSMVLMGVTSALGGNCGDNRWDPKEYLDILDRQGTATNIALMAGHTFLRNRSGGTDKYRSGGVDKYSHIDDTMLAAMIANGQECLEAGCFGVSFGVKYIPGTEWKEISGLAGLCRADDRLVSSHVRADVAGVFDAARELADIGREAGVKVQFSHIGSMGGYGQMEQLLHQLEGYRAEGVDLMCDCYPYDAFSTGIGETTYDEGFLESYQSDYSHIQLCDGPYAGQRCTKEIFDELRKNAPETMTIGYFMREKDVEMALKSPMVMLASDGLRNGPQGHPRAAGTFPRFLNRYVKTGKIPLEEAIRKMTWTPAQRIGLPSKGTLRLGSDADIVIFDLDTIEDLATYESPDLPPKGIDYVILKGEIAVDHGQLVRDDLGRSLRFGGK